MALELILEQFFSFQNLPMRFPGVLLLDLELLMQQHILLQSFRIMHIYKFFCYIITKVNQCNIKAKTSMPSIEELRQRVERAKALLNSTNDTK